MRFSKCFEVAGVRSPSSRPASVSSSTEAIQSIGAWPWGSPFTRGRSK